MYCTSTKVTYSTCWSENGARVNCLFSRLRVSSNAMVDTNGHRKFIPCRYANDNTGKTWRLPTITSMGSCNNNELNARPQDSSSSQQNQNRFAITRSLPESLQSFSITSVRSKKQFPSRLERIRFFFSQPVSSRQFSKLPTYNCQML